MPDGGRQGLPVLRAEGGGLRMLPQTPTRPAAPPATDKTLDLDLAAITDESRRLAAATTPDSGPWDVIVVGSGAAGGMAAFQLATAGIKVLVLEAGRMLDHKREYRTMEWPYASPRRQRLPGDHRALQVAEYNFLDRPYGNNPVFDQYKKVASYAGNSFTRNWVVNEKEHPTTGTPYSWVRARVLGGKTNFWGRVAIRYGPLQFQAAEPRRLRRGLAARLRRHRAVLRQGGPAARRLRHQGRPRPGAGRDLPAADQDELRGDALQEGGGRPGPQLHPRPRRREHGRAAQPQVPVALPRPRALQPRLRRQRRLPLPGRARSIPRATRGTSPSGPTPSSPRSSSTRRRDARPACASSTRTRRR